MLVVCIVVIVCEVLRAQKWSKGKQKEKVNNMVLFDQGTYDKLLVEVPKYKLITPSVLSDRLRVSTHSSFIPYGLCISCLVILATGIYLG